MKMKKYPDGILESAKWKIDELKKFMYVPQQNGGINVFQLDGETLDVLPELTLKPKIMHYEIPLTVTKKPVEGLDAHCIYVSPLAVDDIQTVFAVPGKAKPIDPDFKIVKAVHCALRECYGHGWTGESTLAVYDQNKDFKGLIGLLGGR